MTIQSNIVATTSYDVTDDVDAAIDKAFRRISLHLGETYVEGTDTDIDVIAEDLAVYYLIQKRKGEQGAVESAIEEQAFLPKHIKQLLDGMIVMENPAINFKFGRAEPDYDESSWGE